MSSVPSNKCVPPENENPPAPSEHRAEARQSPDDRIGWVDYAKGVCIIAVVAMYSTGYVEDALGSRGWMHYFVDFAQPFRMPDFFLISGLFVARVAGRRWQHYLDSKVLHFFYFYALWNSIRFLIQDGPRIFGPTRGYLLDEYLGNYLQPHGPLWFIYMLPLFFLTVRLVKPLPAWAVLFAAVALKLIDLDTGWKMIDRFGLYFVFFYAGHLFASRVFALADWSSRHPRETLFLLVIWFAANALLVHLGLTFIPAVHLLTGLAGASAVVLFSVHIGRLKRMQWLRYLGRHSIVVYLAFVVPLAVMRRLFFVLPPHINSGTVAFGTIVLSIAGAMFIYWAVRNTQLRFLFERPAWVSLRPATPAEARPG